MFLGGHVGSLTIAIVVYMLVVGAMEVEVLLIWALWAIASSLISSLNQIFMSTFGSCVYRNQNLSIAV